jgi:hypothetical protein
VAKHKRKHTVMAYLRKDINYPVSRISQATGIPEDRYLDIESRKRKPTKRERHILEFYFAGKAWPVLSHKVWIRDRLSFYWPDKALHATRSDRVTKPSSVKIKSIIAHFSEHGYKFTKVFYPLIDGDFTLTEYPSRRKFRATELGEMPASWRRYVLTGRVDVPKVFLKSLGVKMKPFQRSLLEASK